MAGNIPLQQSRISIPPGQSTIRARLTGWLLTALALGFIGFVVVIPLVAIFTKAFEQGLSIYVNSITNPDALAAIKLTLLIAGISIPLNTIFGLAAAWAITKFNFKGKSILITIIDLPFSVSPVIAGLIFVLLFGAQSFLGPWLSENNIKIIFAVPGLVLATLFVTFPFVSRELIPLMQSQGITEEEAALSLGASGWKTFWHITLPNIKWGLLYGVLLSTARAVGEFGAVSVVSGHIRGHTNTMPLYIEILYNEYKFTAAFAVASLMSIMALITLLIKNILEWKVRKELNHTQSELEEYPDEH